MLIDGVLRSAGDDSSSTRRRVVYSERALEVKLFFGRGRGESNHSHLPAGTAVFQAMCAARDFTFVVTRVLAAIGLPMCNCIATYAC